MLTYMSVKSSETIEYLHSWKEYTDINLMQRHFTDRIISLTWELDVKNKWLKKKYSRDDKIECIDNIIIGWSDYGGSFFINKKICAEKTGKKILGTTIPPWEKDTKTPLLTK